MPLLLAFLKMLGSAAAKGAVGLGKTAVTGAKVGAEALGKGATEMGKWGWNRMQQGAGLSQPISIDTLTKAFGLVPPIAEATELPQETIPMDFDINPQTQQLMRVPMGTSQMLPKTPQEYSNFPPTTPTIPSQYLNIMSQQQPRTIEQQPPRGIAGFLQSMGYGALGKPIDMEQRGWEAYAGKLFPDFMRSRMKMPTETEVAMQQVQREAISGKKPSPEYKKDLQEAINRLADPKLSEVDKIMIYQQLVTVYPERSAEIKRIIFPQSSDNYDDLLKGIISGSMYGR